MAQARSIIDITDNPELLRIVERAREAREPIILRAKGEDIAIVSVTEPEETEMVGVLTREQFEAAMSAAGTLKGQIDPEQVKAEIKEARGSRRPPKRTKTQADFEAFLSTFGGWDDVDGEALKAELRAARGSNRPPVKL